MKHNSKNTALSCVVLLFANVFGTAIAQETEGAQEPDIAGFEEIVVFGTREAERLSIAEKFDATVVLEALNASDIGELPEQSIAEALEQLTAVSGERDRGRTALISVRGMGPDSTLVTINGREVASPFGNRSTLMRLIPAEALTKAYVYKTAIPSQVEGGIGGTVEMQTLRPLSKKQNVYQASYRALYNELTADSVKGENGIGTRASAIISQKLLKDTLGVALGASYNEQTLLNSRLFTDEYDDTRDYNGDSVNDFAPNTLTFQPDEITEERSSVFGVFEWQPTADINVLSDFFWSDLKNDRVRNGLQFSSLRNNVDTATAQVDLIDNELRFADVPNAQVRSLMQDSAFDDDFLVGGLTLGWSRDAWQIKADVSHSRASRSQTQEQAQARFNNVPLHWDTFGDVTPNIIIGPSADINDPANFNLFFVDVRSQVLEDELSAYRLDLSRAIDAGPLVEVNFGARVSDRDKTFMRNGDRANLTGPNRFSLDTRPEILTPFPLDDFFGSTSSAFPTEWVTYSPQAALRAIEEINGPTERPFTETDALRSYELYEDTNAIYAGVIFDMEIAGLSYSGEFGVRYIETDVSSRSQRANIELVTDPVTGELVEVNIDPDTLVDFNTDSSYSEWLPSFNSRLRLNEALQLRLGVGKALQRAQWSQLNPSLRVRAPGTLDPGEEFLGTASAGNPELEPIVSTQFDLALEWSPQVGSLYAFGFFFKDLDSQFARATVVEEIEGVNFEVTKWTAVDGGILRGYEVSFKQELSMLPGLLSNIGVSGNYTYMDIDIQIDYNLNPDEESFYNPLKFNERLYNLSTFYDSGRFQFRVAYSYQSDVTPGGADVKLESEALSASFKYKFNKHVNFVLQGSNLSNELQRHAALGRNESAPDFDRVKRAGDTGRRWFAGFDVRF